MRNVRIQIEFLDKNEQDEQTFIFNLKKGTVSTSGPSLYPSELKLVNEIVQLVKTREGVVSQQETPQ